MWTRRLREAEPLVQTPAAWAVGLGLESGAVGTGVAIRLPPKIPSAALENLAASKIFCLDWQVPFHFLQAFQWKHDSAI